MDAYPVLNEANCSQVNLTNKTCFSFSSKDFEAIFGAKVGVAGVAVFACCVAIFLIFISKAYKRFVLRLTLYLAIAALIYSVVFILQIMPVEARCGFVVVRDEQFCIAAGFLPNHGYVRRLGLATLHLLDHTSSVHSGCIQAKLQVLQVRSWRFDRMPRLPFAVVRCSFHQL